MEPPPTRETAYAVYELAKMERDGIGTPVNTQLSNTHFKMPINVFLNYWTNGVTITFYIVWDKWLIQEPGQILIKPTV